MTRREILFYGISASVVAGIEGGFGWDLYATSKKKVETLQNIERNHPNPPSSEINNARTMVDQYKRCQEVRSVQRSPEDVCGEVMRREAQEIYNAASILEQQRVHQEEVSKRVKPLNVRMANDAAVIGTGIGAVIGAISSVIWIRAADKGF